MKMFLRRSWVYSRVYAPIRDFYSWFKNGFTNNSPDLVKRRLLMRHAIHNATFVETGTFLGNTTVFLASFSAKTYTIEPEEKLYEMARQRFANSPKIDALKGTSEERFPELLPLLSGDINFWLDGHYSGGITFKGDSECPVASELEQIEKNLVRFDKVSVLIDDVRCFPLSQSSALDKSDYPPLDTLVDWARRNKFSWQIEHDIFIAKNH
ncbi:O-methyltransferase [Candidatus Puniceispirillum marinum]|uniref:Class I SAM-dependent methyltransferase n=1 Tax=Puniceispirillum marinum (strain IMCC1322) TaxID=488538 RepID=D5BN06_PUNMI|nr:hypothetical protein [Candidatus Puniceispirillum marinum]ADE40199.1 hypothetical protein SAR116_1956 [Candidatus Puniceispirillum marinum IMCC1322]